MNTSNQFNAMFDKGLHVRTFKNYCVAVNDWTPLRLFWTRDGAIRWRDSVGQHAHAYKWHSNVRKWIEMNRGPHELPGYCDTCGGNTKTGPYCGQC